MESCKQVETGYFGVCNSVEANLLRDSSSGCIIVTLESCRVFELPREYSGGRGVIKHYTLHNHDYN